MNPFAIVLWCLLASVALAVLALVGVVVGLWFVSGSKHPPRLF